MNWRSFRQLPAVVQLAIVGAVLALLLAVAFDKEAGNNIVNFLLAISALAGGGTLLKARSAVTTKRRKERHAKGSSADDSSRED